MLLLLICHVESDNSDSEISDLTSNVDNDACVENSASTPLTPLSSKASPRHPSDLKTIHCPYENCNKSFNRPAKLSQHLRSHTNTRLFNCPHAPCTKDFLRESHLKHHVKSAHSDVRDYICEWQGCGKSFITATRLRRHHAAHEGREKFRCTVTDCGQTFRKHGTLQKHVTTIHEGRHPYVCELLNDNGVKCGAGFDTEGRLESHAGRIHGTKKFLCTVCPFQQDEGTQSPDLGENGAAFPSHAALQAHIQNEHPPTCTECGLKCTSKSALKSHVEVLHGGLDVNERKVHVCPEPDCGRAFTKKGNMNAHIQIGHAGKRFVCGAVDLKTLNHVGNWDGSDACGEASTSKRNLERHICTIHLGLDASGKSRKKGKHQSLAEPAHNNQVSALTRLTGSGYETATGRNVTCLVQGCNHRFVREYDLEIHLQSRHGLADLEIQMMMEEEELYTRQSFHGAPMYATEQDLEAERVFDQQFGNDVAIGNSEDSLESGTIGDGDLWLRGDPSETATRDSWLHDEVAMQHLINDDYEGENVEGRLAQDAHNGQNVVMIDPSLR